jgi:hypothetical protein
MASESGSSQAERPRQPTSELGEEVIIKPGINDVLCGRGGGINNHGMLKIQLRSWSFAPNRRICIAMMLALFPS